MTRPRQPEAILELMREVNHKFHQFIKGSFGRSPFGGRYPGFAVMLLMRLIGTDPGITVSELARRIGLAKSHVSKTVESLSGQGYVERRSDPEDQRVLKLYWTEKAKQTVSEMHEEMRELFTRVIGLMPEDKALALADGLEALDQALDQVMEKETPG